MFHFRRLLRPQIPNALIRVNPITFQSRLFHKNTALFTANAEKPLQKFYDFIQQKDYSQLEKEAQNLVAKFRRDDIDLDENLIEEIANTMDNIRKSGHEFKEYPPHKVYLGTVEKIAKKNVETAISMMEKALQVAEDDVSKGLIIITRGNLLFHKYYEEEGEREDLELGVKSHEIALNMIKIPVNREIAIPISLAWFDLGYYYLLETQERQKALQYLQKAFLIREKFLGWRYLPTLDACELLCRVYFEKGDYKQGILLAEKCLVGLELLEKDAVRLTTVVSFLARGYEKENKFSEQQHVLERAIHLLESIKEFTDEHTYLQCLFRLKNLLSACRYLQGDYLVAHDIQLELKELLPKIIDSWKQSEGEVAKHEEAYFKFFLASTMFRLQKEEDKYDQTMELLKEARELFEQSKQQDWVDLCDKSLKELAEIKERKKEENKEEKKEEPKQEE